MAIHKKTGHFYEVIGVAQNSTNGHENDEQMVIYTRNGQLFARSVSEFKDKFEQIEIFPPKYGNR